MDSLKLIVWHDRFQSEHDPGPDHPEQPVRIEACLRALEGSGVGVELREPAPAERAPLELVHDPSYLDGLETLAVGGDTWIDPDTYLGPQSLRVAARASGACLGAVRAAIAEGVRSFCLIRPPGHHAERSQAMGFCLLNHAAVAAAQALELGARRVMSLDFDVHHGNGTQRIFWDDPRVLYVSLHQWPWYPWRTGALEEIGGQGAEGTNLNIPLPAGSGDDVYLAAMSRVVAPAGRAFRPELLILSSGFDAHRRDPLAMMNVTEDGFGRLVLAAVLLAEELCQGRVVATLEGGYDLQSLGGSFVATVRALVGSEAPGVHEIPKTPGSVPQAVVAAEAFHRGSWE